ncbi:DUF1287 domain-containing protein [Profundibacter amoris]|nr:DUF1287 domain-containing protein [Profundibacter amoris]
MPSTLSPLPALRYSPLMTLITKHILVLFLFASLPFSSTATGQETAAQSQVTTPWSTALIQSAREQIGVTLIYDGSYQSLEFPNGDVPRQRGVCTDVVIRALRDAHSFDLQAKVNADMKAHFSSYPKFWGLSRPDSNIDHRRVPNLITYFKRHRADVPMTDEPQDYLPGDIVTWMLRPGTPHVGIVSDKVDPQSGNPLIIHNIGWGTRENDILFAYEMTGHFRPENGNY